MFSPDVICASLGTLLWTDNGCFSTWGTGVPWSLNADGVVLSPPRDANGSDEESSEPKREAAASTPFMDWRRKT